MDTLNIIGCGRVGQSLGRVWTRDGLLQVQGLLARSFASAQRAAAFLGQGIAVSRLEGLPPADFYMVSTPDDAIAGVARQLAASGILRPGAVVFHCSGSLGSDALEPIRRCGAFAASAHPLKTFADPARAAGTFAGTPCGLEGDDEACRPLETLLTRSGGRVFRLQPGGKILYHAGTVLACNYLTALVDLAAQCLEASGLPRGQSLELVLPLARETLENIARLGPEQALTGPVARGDAGLAARQAQAVADWNARAGAAYKALGLAAVDLTKRRGGLSREVLEAMANALESTRISTPPARPPRVQGEDS